MIAGVDGCKGGWVVAMAERWPTSSSPKVKFCPSFQEVLEFTKDCRVTVVDMPIGLPDGAQVRECDRVARFRLGARASSVFFTPPRETLYAETPEEFQAHHREIHGKGAGMMVWGILSKIREVDELMTCELQERVKEFHPELAWMNLNEGASLSKKKTAGGLLQRIHLLERYSPGTTKVWESNGVEKAKLDDVLDALIGLPTAQAIVDGPDWSRRLPRTEIAPDSKGLQMEIWF